MPRHFTSALPSWLPGFLSYLSLLVINAILSSIAIITLNNVPTALGITLVAFNSLAGIILVTMLFYKALSRSCVFNNIRSDKKILFCVTILDLSAAVAWSVRLDTNEFCGKPSGNTIGSCHTALIAAGLVLAWTSVIISYAAAVYADHGGAKKKRLSPQLSIHVPKQAISSPVIIHAGQFSENDPDVDSKFISFTNVPVGGSNRGHLEDV